jgi:hypothetical protein
LSVHRSLRRGAEAQRSKHIDIENGGDRSAPEADYRTVEERTFTEPNGPASQ